MRYEITLPSGIPTEGKITVGRWHKEIGDHVLKSEIIVEVETPTTILEIESEVEGTLSELQCQTGQEVTPADILAIIENNQPALESEEEPPRAVEEVESDSAPAAPQPVQENAVGPAITDRARWLAVSSGVDINTLQGSGPGGRIVVKDVEEAIEQRHQSHEQKPAAPQKDVAASMAAQQVALGPAERVLAHRMTQSHRDIPQYNITIAADATRLVEWRKGRENAPHITAILVKLCAEAMADYPRINATFSGHSWRPNTDVNVAVAVDTPNGMVWPVIHHCQRKSLDEISAELAEEVDLLREGSHQAQDPAEANFSVSNLGMHGVESFTAAVWPGQVAVLAIGAIREEPVILAGELVSRSMIRLTLGCDRRVLEGTSGARFLARLKELVESAKL